MPKRKITKKYYFSVEGDTENWYLVWLKETINNTTISNYNVDFECRVQKDPLKYAKNLKVITPVKVYHLCDYEGNEEKYIKQFEHTISNMKGIKNLGSK